MLGVNKKKGKGIRKSSRLCKSEEIERESSEERVDSRNIEIGSERACNCLAFHSLTHSSPKAHTTTDSNQISNIKYQIYWFYQKKERGPL